MPDGDEVELIDYLYVLWKWKWLILGGTVMAALVAFVGSVQTPRVYEASTTLLVTESKIPVPGLAEIIKNESSAAEAIQRFRLDNPPYKIAVKRFLSSLFSVRPGKGASILTLTVTLPDPRLAADTANFLAQKAVELYARLTQDAPLTTLNNIQQQRDQAREVFGKAKAALSNFKRTANLESLQVEQKILLDQRVRLAQLLTETTTEQASLRAMVEELSSALKQQEPVLTLNKSIFTDPSLLATAQEQGAVEMKALSALRLMSQESNAVYQDLRREVINRGASLASLEGKREDLEQKTRENKRRSLEIWKRMVSAESKLEELTRSYSLAQADYEFWAKKADDAALSIVNRAAELKILDPAIVPTTPVSRNVKQKVGIAGAGALMACVMLAFFLEYLLGAKRRREKIAGTAFS